MCRTEPGPATAGRLCDPIPGTVDPAVQALVRDIVGKVTDRWTMLILEALEERGALRFAELGRHVGNVSQKMLTKTGRQMRCDGLVHRAGIR